MKLLALVLCLALGAAWVRPARAEEAGPNATANFEGLEPGWDAAETYRLNALTIVHEQISGSFLTFNVGRSNWWRPVRGKFRRPTRYDDFYLKVGRDDLGERDRHRGVLSSTLYWGGVLASIGGLGVFLWGLDSSHTTRVEVGLGMFAGGFLMTTIGSNIQPPLVSDEEAEALAKTYNRQLQAHLGLAPVATRDARDRLSLGIGLTRRW
jgi:hypothetical protein